MGIAYDADSALDLMHLSGANTVTALAMLAAARRRKTGWNNILIDVG